MCVSFLCDSRYAKPKKRNVKIYKKKKKTIDGQTASTKETEEKKKEGEVEDMAVDGRDAKWLRVSLRMNVYKKKGAS